MEIIEFIEIISILKKNWVSKSQAEKDRRTDGPMDQLAYSEMKIFRLHLKKISKRWMNQILDGKNNYTIVETSEWRMA